MGILLAILGITLLLAAVVDILWTTLWIDGKAGPLTGRLTSTLWGLVRGSALGRRQRNLFGPAILSLTIGVWVFLLWAGWTLLFALDAGAIVSANDQAPAGWVERLYFVGYTLFTLGNGDFKPAGSLWQLATVLLSASGLVLLTLVITYVGAVISAVVAKRSVASQISALGSSAGSLVAGGWNGRDFHSLDLPLNTLASQLAKTTEQHYAYPILHNYRAQRGTKSPAVALAVLDEALTLLRFGVPEECRPNPVVLASTRVAVAEYLDTLRESFVEPAPTAPPLPDLAHLRQSGIPTVADETFVAATGGLEERRRQLLGLVQDAGWSWPNQGLESGEPVLLTAHQRGAGPARDGREGEVRG